MINFVHHVCLYLSILLNLFGGVNKQYGKLRPPSMLKFYIVISYSISGAQVRFCVLIFHDGDAPYVN